MPIILIIAGILIICLIAICIISVVENQKLTVTQYKITSPKIPKAFQDCRLLVLADLHNASFGENNRRLLQMIQEQQPDYVLIAGDMIIGQPKKSTEIPEQLIKELAKEYPVYYGKGNHELRVGLYTDTYGDMWKHYQEQLEGKVTWLENDLVHLVKEGEQISLYGLDLAPRYYKRLWKRPMATDYLTQVLGAPEPEAYRILIAHNPDYFPDYANWGADLVLSGHLHGGLIRLPWLGGMLSPMFHFFPKYDRGRYEEGESVMLLSGGLGNHTFKFRVNNLPEIMVITLSSGKEETEDEA